MPPSFSFQEIAMNLASSAPRILMMLISLSFWLAYPGRRSRGMRLLGVGLLSDLTMVTAMPILLVIVLQSPVVMASMGGGPRWINLLTVSFSALGSIPLAVIVYAAFLLAREAEEMSESPPEGP